ncbi:MAG: DUF4012 domain-containing protein [Candidatus Doudnabacteria bacterium]|nr:DUF4012 domain-containing protein [Candidatus Doudnabacteria bacterium]
MKVSVNNNDIKPKSNKPVNRVPEPLQFIVHRSYRSKKRVFLQLGSFVLSAALLISLIQGAGYLSSAKNASGEILGAATTAYDDLNNAGKNLSQQNLTQAGDLFASAQANVKLAQDKLNNYKPLTWVAPQANSADHILKGAGYLASAGGKLSNALNIFSELKVSSKGVETSDFEQKLTVNKNSLKETRELVAKASSEFNQVNSIPLDYENTLQKAKDQVSQLENVLDKLIGLEELYLGIFGGQKTYLLIFQNYDEQRATGGFIGTYGVLKTKHGTISKLSIDSIYDLDGRINELVAAPGPFQPDIPRWGIRDSNWFIDFPTSAKKLLYFFEKGQETADGVLSLTPKVFEQLLTIVGPIEMKDYDVTLTAENFQDVVQYKTSVDYDRKENEPKKMLADFAPILLDRLTNLPQDEWLEFFQIMQDNLSQRHVLVYSKDSQIQKSIDDLGFSGKVLSTDHDYLLIANTNLGGTKTDLKIEQNVELKSKILSDGSILNSLEINRKNTSQVKNRNYLRVLVPKESEFISSTGFDTQNIQNSSAEGLVTDPDLMNWDKGDLRGNVFVRSESGKREFAGWINTEGETEKTITINYMLPFKISSVHSLLVQKQAGSKPYKFTSSLKLGGRSADSFTNGVSISGNSLIFGSNTNTDDFWGFIIK